MNITTTANKSQLSRLLMRTLVTSLVCDFFQDNLKANSETDKIKFQANNADVDTVLSVVKDFVNVGDVDSDMLANGILNEELLFNLLDCCIRIDSKTGRLITQGWCLYTGKYYFGNEDDALEQVKKDGFESLGDAFDADPETYYVEFCGW